MFVGRDEELERATSALDDAVAGGTHAGPLEFVNAPLAGTGRSFTTTHIHIFRVAGGKIVEHWAERDDLGLMKQLGVLPGKAS